MIKIDYEGAWKELKEEYKECFVDCMDAGEFRVEIIMNKIEQNHTKEEKEEGGYLFRDDGGYGTEMIKKHKDYINKNKKGGEK